MESLFPFFFSYGSSFLPVVSVKADIVPGHRFSGNRLLQWLACGATTGEGKSCEANGRADPSGESPHPGAGQDAALPAPHREGRGRPLCLPPRGHGGGNGQAPTCPPLSVLLPARKRRILPPGSDFRLRTPPSA